MSGTIFRHFSLAFGHKLCINEGLPSLGNLQAVSLAPPTGGAFFALRIAATRQASATPLRFAHWSALFRFVFVRLQDRTVGVLLILICTRVDDGGAQGGREKAVHLIVPSACRRAPRVGFIAFGRNRNRSALPFPRYPVIQVQGSFEAPESGASPDEGSGSRSTHTTIASPFPSGAPWRRSCECPGGSHNR